MPHFLISACYNRALLPSIICLGRLRIASKYIFNLWQLRQGVDSLAQWLEYWIFNREDRVRFPRKAEYFFSYASFLCYDFHVVRSHNKSKVSICSMQTVINQISQRICIIWSGLSLFVYIFYTIQPFCKQTRKALIRLCKCTIWSGPSLIALGFNNTSTLVGHFVSSSREREKRDRRISRGDERGTEEKEEQEWKTEEIKKHSPFALTCYKDSRPCLTVGQYQLDVPGIQDTFATLDHPSSGPSLSTYATKTIFSWHDSNNLCHSLG